MKHNILYLTFAGAALVGMSSCCDYLNVSSPSVVDASVVTSSYDNCRSAMDGSYTTFHAALQNQFHANGYFYAIDQAGSDMERHGGERNTDRLAAETFYNGGNEETLRNFNPITEFKDSPDDPYSRAYSIINQMNIILEGITSEQLEGSDAAKYKQIYGEAVCMKATCYRELIKIYGDVPFMDKLSDIPDHLTSRLEIYDRMISDLQTILVGGYLAKVTATTKNNFSEEYAYGLLGRIAMEAAGYQSYRTDVTASDKLEACSGYTAAHDAIYGRPTNYKEYYDIAYDAFKAVYEDQGNIGFDANDYTTLFTQLHEYANTDSYADESIFEDAYAYNVDQDERPYSFGRPSNGSSSNPFPQKGYAQTHVNFAYYYGMYDPKDVRRDVTWVVTGSDGKGFETLVPFALAKQANGAGISLGKYDECRQTEPNLAQQRRSGINDSYMRISEIYLGLAEAAIMKTTPDQATAIAAFNKTYTRAMGTPYSGTSLTLEQVVDERGFEFGGEGDRRFTLIRTGLIGPKVKAVKELTTKILDALKTSDYYTIPDGYAGAGNEVPKYIYTKMLDPKDAKFGFSSRLTGPTPASMRVAGYDPETDLEALQFPGWRGQHDWENDGYSKSGKKEYKVAYYGGTGKSNMAIKGLFKHHDSAPDGYKQQDWISTIVASDDLISFYNTEIFNQWDYQSAPVHYIPFNLNDMIGGLTNGYGFSQSW